ncbi:hypothetical protein BDR07DRAFT_1445169 [Suillus spraguei]|nr:hypothetical protein BDR07DRAFT_1445169 [Suillus spraguei]
MPFLRYLKLLLQVLILAEVPKAASAGAHAVSAALESCFCRSKCPLLRYLRLSVFAAASATTNTNAIPALHLLHLHAVKFLV